MFLAFRPLRFSQSTSLWRPASSRVYVYVLRFRILCIRHFVIYVINNICTRFIIFFTWYVVWYTVHSVVYTCDLILTRIWLLGLCPFINRVSEPYRLYDESLDRTGRVLGLLLSKPCLLKLFCYYIPWILRLLLVLPWFLSIELVSVDSGLKKIIWPS